MRPFAINNSHQYLGFTHLQLFSCAPTYPIRNSTTRIITNIFIFIYICSTCTTTSIRTTSSIFIFICTCGTSISTTTKTTTSTRITTNIFMFIYIRGTSTSTSSSIFATFLMTKLAFIVPASQRVCTMIRPSAFYPSLISLHGSSTKILKHLSMASWIDSVRRVKTMFFDAIFDKSIVSWFKVLYIEHKSNRQATSFVTQLRASS